jgi:hypothetical protein
MTLPEVVYHYADASGFMGILKTNSLWATDFRYLNDTQELNYAWDEFIATLAKRKDEHR